MEDENKKSTDKSKIIKSAIAGAALGTVVTASALAANNQAAPKYVDTNVSNAITSELDLEEKQVINDNSVDMQAEDINKNLVQVTREEAIAQFGEDAVKDAESKAQHDLAINVAYSEGFNDGLSDGFQGLDTNPNPPSVSSNTSSLNSSTEEVTRDEAVEQFGEEQVLKSEVVSAEQAEINNSYFEGYGEGYQKGYDEYYAQYGRKSR